MSGYVDVSISFSARIEQNDLPANWSEMDPEDKEDWVTDWIDEARPIVSSTALDSDGEVEWYEITDLE